MFARYVIRRVILMIISLFIVSMLSFAIIKLPPGDFLSSYVSRLMQEGFLVGQEEVDALRGFYGLDRPAYVQYLAWMQGMLRGNLGMLLNWRVPVTELLADRLPMSALIALTSFIFVWLVGLPIGVYSATHKYSLADYVFSFVGFIGLATPNFLIALVALWLYFVSTGQGVVAHNSPR